MEKTRDERLWTHVRFGLLLFFCSVSLVTLLSKYVFRVPVVESERLIQSIHEANQIFKEQETSAGQLSKLKSEIDSLNFDIQQVQRLDEVKREISTLQDSYRQHDNTSKYLFGIQAFRAIRSYFDIKEETSNTKAGNQMIKTNLEDCKANL